MVFDSEKYLAYCLKEHFKDLSYEAIDLIIKHVKAVCGGKITIPYGGIEYKGKNISFSPVTETSIIIDNIEIGLSEELQYQYGKLPGIKVNARFFGNIYSRIECVLLGKYQSDKACCSIVIDDEDDPYRGIYYINLNETNYNFDTDKIYNCPTIAYYDGAALDIIKNNHKDEELKSLISCNDGNLKTIGFIPDNKVDLPQIPKEKSYLEVIESTFANGDNESFDNFAARAFNRGPQLTKKEKPII